MSNYRNGYGIPAGLGVTLKQFNVMTGFFSLPDNTQQEIIERFNKLKSKREMNLYVESLISSDILF